MTKKEIRDFIKEVGLFRSVYVVWVDSTSMGSPNTVWHNVQEIEAWFNQDSDIKTVGFIYRKSKDTICVVGSMSPSQIAAPLKIPIVVIKHIEKLDIVGEKPVIKRKRKKKK